MSTAKVNTVKLNSVNLSTVESTQARSVDVSIRSTVSAKLFDYLELTKPRIAVLSLVTVSVGYSLGSGGNWLLWPLLHALIGIAAVAAGSSALNQYFERTTDALMARTAGRPLPSGRLQPGEALLFGLLSTGLGCLYLATWVNWPTAALAMITFALYAGVYTPLKRVTSFCTAIGAVPGALPPVLGWVAATGRIDFGAFILFAILFLWQFPHFLAIGWLYHDQYRAAGLRMLPAMRPARRVTGLMCIAYSLVLLPISLLPSRFTLAGDFYFLMAAGLGIAYVLAAVRFTIDESNKTARGLILWSLVYLPLLLLSLTWDHFQLLR